MIDKLEQKSESEKKLGCFSQVGNLFLTLFMIGVGRAAGYYLGAYALIPLVGAVIAYFLYSKFLSENKRFIAGSAAVQVGQLIWFSIGAYYAGNILYLLPDLLVLSFGLIWLSVRPGKLPLGLLSAYQILGLAVGGYQLVNISDVESAKALAVHMILRMTALAFMFIAWRALSKKKSVRQEVDRSHLQEHRANANEHTPKSSALKVIALTILGLFAVALLGGAFYWFSFRPEKIRKDCAWVSQTDNKFVLRSDLTDQEKELLGNKPNPADFDLSYYTDGGIDSAESKDWDKWSAAWDRYWKNENNSQERVYNTYYREATEQEYTSCIRQKGLSS